MFKNQSKRSYRKYDASIKRQVLELYEGGYGSPTIAKELDVTERRVRSWITRQRHLGAAWLDKQVYTKATTEFKQSVARQVLEKCLSCEQVALQNGVSISAVLSWVSKVRSEGYDSLSQTKPRGRPPKDMGRPRKKEPQTELEKLQDENLRLKAENALLKKVKALVEARDARLKEIGRKPSKN